MDTYPRHAEDWYVEEPWSVEVFLDAEPIYGAVWDPACGKGTIPKAVETRIRSGHVKGTDLVDRGYGSAPLDFLAYEPPLGHALPDVIISNPPYRHAEAFARKALELARWKVCLLTRLMFLETSPRARFFRESGLTRVFVIADRVNMPPGDMLERGEITLGGGKTPYCWMVWERGYRGEPTVRWLHRPARVRSQARAAIERGEACTT